MKTALIVARKTVTTAKGEFNLLILNDGKQLVIPSKDDKGEPCVSYNDHRKGDTFVATRDSRRNDNEGNPIYSKGEKVTRQTDTTEIVGFCSIEVWKALQ